MSETGIFILVFYLSDIGCKQVGNDCCVGVYHGRQTLVQDLNEEVLTLKLRSLKHFFRKWPLRELDRACLLGPLLHD